VKIFLGILSSPHSLQVTQPTYPLPLYPFYYICWGVHICQKSGSYLEIFGARMVTRSRFGTEDLCIPALGLITEGMRNAYGRTRTWGNAGTY
jgi:hypothetical protein